jgi:hypothetical protein
MENIADILLTLIVVIMSFIVGNLHQRVKKLEQNQIP